MGLTLIEAAKYENRLEHLAVLRTFSEGELLARLPFMNIAGSGLFYSAEQELPSVGFRAVNEGPAAAGLPTATGDLANNGYVDSRLTPVSDELAALKAEVAPNCAAGNLHQSLAMVAHATPSPSRSSIRRSTHGIRRGLLYRCLPMDYRPFL